MKTAHIRKSLVIGVAAAALMATAAGAVNAATDGALVDTISLVFSIKDGSGEILQPDENGVIHAKTEDGEDVIITLEEDVKDAAAFEQQDENTAEAQDNSAVASAKSNSSTVPGEQ
ncbi:MAG: hypothetical protein Q4C72_02910 [Eubacteriales bacterium]|nr:hypothetical protein [Eubacteriales bacterium]